MNKRIRELAEQAVLSVDVVTGEGELEAELAKMYIPDCFAEKFAELIVQECVDACVEANSIRYFVPPSQGQVVLACISEIKRRLSN